MNKRELNEVLENRLRKITNLLDQQLALNKRILQILTALSEPPVIVDKKKERLDPCPKCGCTAYGVGISTTTSAYYPPMYKETEDGKRLVNINPDLNSCLQERECLECGHKYKVEMNEHLR